MPSETKPDGKITWTKEELKEFNRITLQACSPRQMTRIEGRLAIKDFSEKHGIAKCDAMFEALQKRDGKKK